MIELYKMINARQPGTHVLSFNLFFGFSNAIQVLFSP